MRYMDAESLDDGSVIVRVRDDRPGPAWGATEFDVVMSRDDVIDFLRTIGGDPCAHLGRGVV